MTALGRRPPAPAPESAHAGVERLLSYLRAELPAAEADRVREHLTSCRECIDLLLDLEAFERGAPPAAGDGAEQAESWRRLLAIRPWERAAGGTDEDDPAAGPATAAEPPPRRPAGRQRSRPSRLASALGPYAQPALATLLAASLAAAAGLGVRVLQLERGGAAPRPDQPIVDLQPSTVTRGGGGVAEPWRVPRGASFVAVITPDVEAPFAHYEAAILDPAGRTLWRGRLTPDPDLGHLTLGLSRRLLAGDRYTIVLRGSDGERRAEAGTYALEFAPEPAE